MSNISPNVRKITFSDGICGASDCKNEGLLLCTSCRLVEYCGSACQKQDWKHRHKAECKALKSLQHTLSSNTSRDLDSAYSFYCENPGYDDRVLNVMNIIMNEKQKLAASRGGLSSMELFLKADALCKTLDIYFDIKLTMTSAVKLEGHISNVTACLQEMMKKPPSAQQLRMPIFEGLGPQEFFAIFKAKILLPEAKLLLFKSRRTEADALCDQAIDLIKTQVKHVDKRVEYLTGFSDTLNQFGMAEKKKNLLEYLYCEITRTSGLADARLPRILHNLTITVIDSGDLETAEVYSRSALESLTSHCETKNIAILVETKSSLGRVLLERCRTLCDQRVATNSAYVTHESVAAQESSIAALIEEAGAEFKSGVTLCEEEGQLGAPHLSTALYSLHKYYLICGISGEDVEASMWRAVRLAPELYPKKDGHDLALLILGQYYRQQCDVMGSTGTSERPLEKLLELRKFALNAIERLPEQEKDLSVALQNVMDNIAKPFLTLSLKGRSITDDPKAYVVAADQAIRRWQVLPAVSATSHHNESKLREMRRLNHVRQQVAVMVSIALACRFMSADGYERVCRVHDAILWRKDETLDQSGCHSVGKDNGETEIECPICKSSPGDAELQAIYTVLNPRARDLLQRAFRLCQDNTEDTLISTIAGYLETESLFEIVIREG